MMPVVRAALAFAFVENSPIKFTSLYQIRRLPVDIKNSAFQGILPLPDCSMFAVVKDQ
jgi:hypothetical protein